jgi:hypothetical protein
MDVIYSNKATIVLFGLQHDDDDDDDDENEIRSSNENHPYTLPCRNYCYHKIIMENVAADAAVDNWWGFVAREFPIPWMMLLSQWRLFETQQAGEGMTRTMTDIFSTTHTANRMTAGS